MELWMLLVYTDHQVNALHYEYLLWAELEENYHFSLHYIDESFCSI